MSAQSLYQSLRDCLKVSYQVELERSTDLVLEENQNFTLKVIVQNTAPPIAGYSNPTIIFRNIKVDVIRTQYARPTGENLFNLEPSSLRSNESATLKVPMRTLEHRDVLWPGIPEKIAIVRVGADLDLDQFFRIRNTAEVIYDVLED